MSAAGRGPRWLSRCQYGSAPGRTDLIHRARRVAVHSAADHQSGHRVVSWSKGTFRTEKKLHAVVATGHIIDEADEARFSPLTEEHLHCLGRHAFTASSQRRLVPVTRPCRTRRTRPRRTSRHDHRAGIGDAYPATHTRLSAVGRHISSRCSCAPCRCMPLFEARTVVLHGSAAHARVTTVRTAATVSTDGLVLGAFPARRNVSPPDVTPP